jgi:hypothetical protein
VVGIKEVQTDLKVFIKMIFLPFFVFTLLIGCTVPLRVTIEPPGRLEGFMSAKWGASAEECKRAIETDRNKWFQDRTGEVPHALYAFGAYLDHPAILSYFFTPKSKKLYRVDVMFSNHIGYEDAKRDLIEKFKNPSFSQKDVDHWSWEDKSLIILQKDAINAQISFSNGPLLELNQKEGGPLGK